LFNIVGTDRIELLVAASVSVSLFDCTSDHLRHPALAVASAMKLLDTRKLTAIRAMKVLAEIGILSEMCANLSVAGLIQATVNLSNLPLRGSPRPVAHQLA
jgi:hypothetical protein